MWKVSVGEERIKSYGYLWYVWNFYSKTEENPILVIGMVEDVKGRGGSGYVVGKDKEVLESWFGGNN